MTLLEMNDVQVINCVGLIVWALTFVVVGVVALHVVSTVISTA